ncbi:SGNH hydrolase [Gymnopus androsaceus JB14]|uniref:SGNH hydrolase n=1 Tax=Gymnopus androsaceus JB14 TaxID=1447944 RepID=A0A6A4HL74_9AGAR|nr:SGNH hydrolase [Gymnopus androsaceus JB14]
MFSLTVAAVLSLVPSILGQTVYLAGDSTMAPGGDGAGTGTDGWGQYLAQYITLPVSNQAIAGRSARSFTEEGRFTTIINEVKAGDFVVIEFGHNDGLSGTVDNGREDAFGDSLTATSTVIETDGSTEVIHTFNFYMTNAVESLLAKGAIPIVSSQTPDDIWTGDVISAPPRFVAYAQEVAGNTSTTYIDHFDYVAQAFEAIGETTVNTYFPLDHTHTSITEPTSSQKLLFEEYCALPALSRTS